MSGQEDGAELRSVHVAQGQFKTSSRPDTVLLTVLGSCVATCLYDPEAKIGGMNHFLLPDGGGEESRTMTYGVHSMELLINSLMRHGADRRRLRAKIFGGARMIDGLSDIGARNGVFARQFLRQEGIPCEAESLGGTLARRVRFWPATGRAQQRVLQDTRPVERPQRLQPQPRHDAIELF